MTLNLTLLVQAIHFFIAYVLINRLLLKPALKVITDEKEKRDLLQARLEQEKMNVDRARKVMGNRWGECRAYFAHHRPLKEFYSLLVDTTVPLTLEKPSSKEINRLKQELVSVLVSRLERQ